MDSPSPDVPKLEDGDYYFDGDFMVFTEAYHLKRGFCCGSGCRHCPYGLAPAEPEAEPATGEAAG